VEEQERGAPAVPPDVDLAAADVNSGVLCHWQLPDSGGACVALRSR